MRQQVGGTGGELDLANPIREGGHFSTLNNTLTSPGEGPTAKSGRDSALARARGTVKCRRNPGQIKSEPAVK